MHKDFQKPAGLNEKQTFRKGNLKIAKLEITKSDNYKFKSQNILPVSLFNSFDRGSSFAFG